MPGYLDDYEPVEDRIRAFWEDHPEGRILPKLRTPQVSQPGEIIIFEARIWREPAGPYQKPDGIGHAHQRILERPPLKRDGDLNPDAPEWTSPFEVCETSAIGRALANLGYAAKGKRPSREEVSKASAESTRSRSLSGSGEAGGGGLPVSAEGPVASSLPDPTGPIPSEAALAGTGASDVPGGDGRAFGEGVVRNPLAPIAGPKEWARRPAR